MVRFDTCDHMFSVPHESTEKYVYVSAMQCFANIFELLGFYGSIALDPTKGASRRHPIYWETSSSRCVV